MAKLKLFILLAMGAGVTFAVTHSLPPKEASLDPTQYFVRSATPSLAPLSFKQRSLHPGEDFGSSNETLPGHFGAGADEVTPPPRPAARATLEAAPTASSS